MAIDQPARNAKRLKASDEADELIEEVDNKAVLDAGLLAGAQAIEHYEIARYGALVAWAEALGYRQSAKLLRQTLEEEKKTDMLLNKLACADVNARAAEAEEADGHERKAA